MTPADGDDDPLVRTEAAAIVAENLAMERRMKTGALADAEKAEDAMRELARSEPLGPR